MSEGNKPAFPCTFCGKNLASKSARKKHNRKCSSNDSRSIRSLDRDGKMAAFECMAEDLPDGAYWAMAEEFGLGPEDFLE